jgi:hypothetical protein
MLRLIGVILVTVMLALAAATRSSEAATAERHGAILSWIAAVFGLSARGVHQ